MFEGAGSYMGFGYELAKGIPGPITSYAQFQSETISPKYGSKPNPNINPRRAAQKQRLLEVILKGNVRAVPDSESWARLRASHLGKVVSTVLDAPNTVQQHVLSPLMPGDTPEVIYRQTLTGLVYRDDGAPQTNFGGRVDSATFSVRQNEFVDLTHEMSFERFTEAKQPVPVAVNAAWTGAVYARGMRRDPANIVDSIFFKVTTGGALDGTARIKAKVGAGSVYGVATYPVVRGKWMPLFDETLLNDPIGPKLSNPFEIIFWDVPALGVLTLNDEWEIKPRGVVIAPTYTARDVYDHGQAKALVDGNEYIFHTVSMKVAKPKVDDRGIGSIFTQQILDTGDWTVEITLERNYTDRTFEGLIRGGATSSFVLTMTGDRIGASAFRDLDEITVAAAQYDDAGTNVANAGQLAERIVLKGYDNRVNPIVSERIVNTLPVGAV